MIFKKCSICKYRLKIYCDIHSDSFMEEDSTCIVDRKETKVGRRNTVYWYCSKNTKWNKRGCLLYVDKSPNSYNILFYRFNASFKWENIRIKWNGSNPRVSGDVHTTTRLPFIKFWRHSIMHGLREETWYKEYSIKGLI